MIPRLVFKQCNLTIWAMSKNFKLSIILTLDPKN